MDLEVEIQLCVSCRRPYNEHLDLKCLFGPSDWTVYARVERHGIYVRYTCSGCNMPWTSFNNVSPELYCSFCKALWVLL